MVRGDVRARGAVVALAVASMFLACVKYYDERLVSVSSDWKTQIGAFITGAVEKAGTPAGAYADPANQKFYADMKAAIDGESQRVKAASGSPHALDILDKLAKDVENLRLLHESGGEKGLSKALADPAQSAIDTEFRALQTLMDEYRQGNNG